MKKKKVKDDPYEIRLINLANGWVVASYRIGESRAWARLTKQQAIARAKNELEIS